jgi:hypothetical protein
MTIERLINILVTIALIEMMVAVGLGVAFADLISVARNARLLALVIVTASFSRTATVTATLAYGLLEIFGSVQLAAVWAGRSRNLNTFQVGKLICRRNLREHCHD